VETSLFIGTIGNEGGFWESRQRERKLILRELFWWLTDRKYELEKVVMVLSTILNKSLLTLEEMVSGFPCLVHGSYSFVLYRFY
jgi:hypothetical protein